MSDFFSQIIANMSRGRDNQDGLLIPGNIDLVRRPKVKNNGGISTVNTIGVNLDGKEYNLPTVTNDGRLLVLPNGDPDVRAAIQEFFKTGQHLGAYDTPENSTKAAKQLHLDQADLYGLNNISGGQGKGGAITGK